MIRKIITIDREKCNGCGLCANACHEGAIGMAEGKAVLLREDYCDGMGDCLPACPMNAITFEEREAPAYNEQAVKAAKSAKALRFAPAAPAQESCLANWPVQLKLAPLTAPYYEGCHLLVAADCTAYAYARMHEDYMKGRVVLIGCPKLDGIDYSVKLGHILKNHNVADILLLRMTVPCCGGLEYALKTAIEQSGKVIPLSVNIVSPDGKTVR